jgi:mannitol-specific phosphotransferase system IIBC component
MYIAIIYVSCIILSTIVSAVVTLYLLRALKLENLNNILIDNSRAMRGFKKGVKRYEAAKNETNTRL